MATTWLSDSFTEGADLTLASHVPEIGGTWVDHPADGTTATVVAAEGRVKGASTSWTTHYTNTAVPPSADYTVQATGRCSTTGSPGSFGISARHDGTVNTGYFLWYTGSDLSLYKNIAGTTTVLGSYAFSPALNTDYTLKLEVFGDKITGFLGGVPVISVVDSSITATGRAGLRVRANSRIDGLTAATLDPTSSQLSQVVAEVITAPTPSPTLSQVVAEVVTSPNPNLQVYQQVAETVWAPVPALQVYQAAVEVIRANGAETPIVPDLGQQPLTIICC